MELFLEILAVTTIILLFSIWLFWPPGLKENKVTLSFPSPPIPEPSPDSYWFQINRWKSSVSWSIRWGSRKSPYGQYMGSLCDDNSLDDEILIDKLDEKCCELGLKKDRIILICDSVNDKIYRNKRV